ncbi:bacteriohemerythrin [Variovorax sp. M-6]|uniref:bacteriohemerythrin n=1 Tax=Variovorax sp. M-6 TaxID=3233041 RepID=UPI003F95575F
MNSTISPPLAWSDSLLLGNIGIDDEHAVLAECIGRLQSARDEDLALALDEVLAHAAKHFAAENALMLDTAFPPRDCHIKEHEAVLSSLGGVKRRLTHGDVEVARRLADELASWFPAHVQHLDSALSHWLCKLRYGAKPLVLRMGRKSTAESAS